MSQRLSMALIGSLLVAGCAALLFACDEGECIRGSTRMCTEHSGPIEISYCQADGTMSDCEPQVVCNPLDQTGCMNGLACYAADFPDGTLCAPAETLPCPPGEEIAEGIDGVECQPHCVASEDEIDPVCDEGEICWMNSTLPDGVGTCLVIQAD